jgi:hypothetical protein
MVCKGLFRWMVFKICDAIVVIVVGVLLFFAGLISLVLFEKFVGHAKDADCHADHCRCVNHTDFANCHHRWRDYG